MYRLLVYHKANSASVHIADDLGMTAVMCEFQEPQALFIYPILRPTNGWNVHWMDQKA